jgi:hypothetical protein
VVALALVAAWCPTDVWPLAAPLLAAGLLILLPMAWQWRGPVAPDSQLIVAMIALIGVTAVLAAWDREAALRTGALAVGAAGLGWLAGRHAPTVHERALLAVALSALGLWAAYQSTIGFDLAVAFVPELPEALRNAAEMRLRGGRGFASLALPGHLAVLLATSVPLLLAVVRRRPWRIPAVAGLGAVAVGLWASQSVLGAGLAVVAAAVTVRGARWQRLVAIGAVIAVLGVVVAKRGDLVDLEPLQLRWDNWRTAVWAWSQSPIVGLGPGGMAQAAQAVPFPVGNQTGFAHSLPLQLLVDHGVAGLGLLVLLASWLCRQAKSLWSMDRELAVALLVVPVHNLLDFSCYRSGVLLPWAVLAGWAWATTRGPLPARSSRSVGRVVAVTVASLAVACAVLDGTARIVERAALSAVAPERAWHLASRATQLAPWRLTPRMVLLSRVASGKPTHTAVSVRRQAAAARTIRPQSASVVTATGAARLARGDLVGAAACAGDATCYCPGSEGAERLRRRLQQLGAGLDVPR